MPFLEAFCILQELYDKTGNYVMFDSTITENKFILVNINDQNTDSALFLYEYYISDTRHSTNYQCRGFDMILNKDLDTLNYKNCFKKARQEVFPLMKTLNL